MKMRSILLFLALGLAAVLGALVIIGTVYEEEAKAELIGTLNARLNAPVSVGDVELTLIRRFPNASLHLKNVLAQEARAGSSLADTLLYAEDIHLEFDLWDLFFGTYTIDRIHASDVIARPARDADGEPNWLIWKSDSSAANTVLDLRMLSFTRLNVRYSDASPGLDLRLAARQLELSGTFSENMNAMQLRGDIRLDTWQQHDAMILADRTAELELKMTFGGEDKAFRITNGSVILPGVRLTTTLAVIPEPRGTFIDLRAAGDKNDLDRLFAQLPTSITAPLRRYGLSGEADIITRYSGVMGEGTGPILTVQAALREGRMKEQSTGVTFSAIHAWIEFELNGDGTLRSLTVNDLSTRTGSGSVRGSMVLRPGAKGHVKGDLKVDISLSDLLRFARIDTLAQAEGKLAANLAFTGPYTESDVGVKDALKHMDINGSIRLRDASLALKGIRHRATAMNMDLSLGGKNTTLERLDAELMGNSVSLSGSLTNLVPYILFDKEKLTIQAKATSEHIDLAAWLARSENESGSEYALRLPALIAMDLSVDVKELTFEKFVASGITGHIVMADKVLRADPVIFTSASGKVEGGLSLDGRKGPDHQLHIHADLTNINVSDLFAEFQDFGQSFLRHDQLYGTAKAHVDLRSPLTRSFTLDLDRLQCDIDLVIDNGRLKGHAPLMAVADHVRKNKLIAPFVDTRALEERLSDVHFEQLRNRIEIRDQQVRIPLMDVHSSALDLEMSGMHGFNDVIDHHLNFRLGDLLRKGPPQDEFGPVIDDGTGLRVFLHMYGTATDPLFETDNAMAADRRQRQWKEEKKDLGNILRDEFGGKKKSDVDTTTPPKKAPGFEVQWGDSVVTKAHKDRSNGKDRSGEKEVQPQVTFEVVE